MMIYKQPVTDTLDKVQNILNSVITGMEYKNISAVETFEKLKLLKEYLNKVKHYIDIEKE